MTATSVRTRSRPWVRLPRPDRPTAVVWGTAAAAWLLLVALAVLPSGGHAHHHGAAGSAGPGWWVIYPAMVVAMMWPLTAPAVSLVVRSSFRSRRVLHATIVLGVGTALWLAFGAALQLVAGTLGWTATPAWTVGWLGVGLAVTWLPRRARVLWTCLRLPPLHPGGARGVRTAALAGWASWRRCAILCGPLMAAMVGPHALAVMALATAAAWWEQWHARAAGDPVPRLLVAGALAAAALGGSGLFGAGGWLG